jgi:hypothetical protein
VSLLNAMLVRAADGKMSASDSIKLADAIARLEGLTQARKPDVQVYLVQFDPTTTCSGFPHKSPIQVPRNEANVA